MPESHILARADEFPFAYSFSTGIIHIQSESKIRKLSNAGPAKKSSNPAVVI